MIVAHSTAELAELGPGLYIAVNPGGQRTTIWAAPDDPVAGPERRLNRWKTIHPGEPVAGELAAPVRAWLAGHGSRWRSVRNRAA